MDRRVFVSTMVGGALPAAPSGARAQQAGKVYRIGMLERTSKFELSINLKTPPSLLQRADQVIE